MDKTTFLRHLFSTVLLLIFLAYSTGMISLPLIKSLEKQAYDFRINLSRQTGVDQRIVIVDIDEKSLEHIGRWPWSRHILAEMINNLFDDYQVEIVGFDILFSEKDESSGLKVMENLAANQLKNNEQYKTTLQTLKPQFEYDEIFAKAIKNRNVVLGYFFTHSSSQDTVGMEVGALPDPVYLLDDDSLKIPFVNTNGYGSNLELLQNNAKHGGFIDLPIVDDDGVIRAIPMVQQYGAVLYESLSLAMIRSMLDFPPLNLYIADEYADNETNLGLEEIEVDGFRIPVDERGAALVPYRGPYGSFEYISAIDILNRTASLDTLQGAMILVGTTAAGLLDVRSTPVQNIYPGVEVHANLIAGIFDQSIKKNPAYVNGVLIVSIIIVWLCMAFIISRQGFGRFIFGSLFLAFIVTYSAYYAWQELHLVLPIATQLVFLGSLFVYYLLYSYFIENRSKRQLTKVFRQYIPPELVDELGDQASDSIEGQTRDMTVLFSDIRGFTSLSENMRPKDLTRMMNCYFTAMTKAIQQQRGTIDKYIGDAIMAFWGAPIYDKNHAQLAVEAAMDMLEQLKNQEQIFQENNWPLLDIGIGINTGPMYVGNIGSQFRMSYTVLGDAVNLGSRLEALTKQYNTPLIVSESTKLACPDYIFRELDRVRVAGKTEPVSIYQPMGKQQQIDEDCLKRIGLYEDALEKYRAREWRQAKEMFLFLDRAESQSIYREYIKRCEFFETSQPTADWDGVFSYTKK